MKTLDGQVRALQHEKAFMQGELQRLNTALERISLSPLFQVPLSSPFPSLPESFEMLQPLDSFLAVPVLSILGV